MATRCPGTAGFVVELRVRLLSESIFWISPGPHPLLFWLKIPGFEAAISIENGLLADPPAVTMSADLPRGAASGMIASILSGSTASTRTGDTKFPLRTDTVAADPKRTPRMVNAAPRAMGPPGSVVGIWLARFTTPFCPIPGWAKMLNEEQHNRAQ